MAGLWVRRAVAASVLVALSTPVWAAGDAREGEQLVARWCASCHATGAAPRGSDMAPPFAKIANDPARTPTRLRSWLTNPHPPMPNLALTRTDIDNILAWLDTLKVR